MLRDTVRYASGLILHFTEAKSLTYTRYTSRDALDASKQHRTFCLAEFAREREDGVVDSQALHRPHEQEHDDQRDSKLDD